MARGQRDCRATGTLAPPMQAGGARADATGLCKKGFMKASGQRRKVAFEKRRYQGAPKRPWQRRDHHRVMLPGAGDE
jgi:hypothetical protein